MLNSQTENRPVADGTFISNSSACATVSGVMQTLTISSTFVLEMVFAMKKFAPGER